MQEKKLDEEYPSLSMLPKLQNMAPVSAPLSSQGGNSPSSANKSQQPPKQYNITINMPPSEQFAAISVRGPDQFLETDLSAQDFGHALASSINMIPDAPYDAPESLNDFTSDSGFPVFPNMRVQQPDFLRKFDLSTLFFIFYFSPGSSQQYFAAQELKRRDWIYNTKLQKWFHRLAEPTEKTQTYEVAKFEYFDYSETWCIRQSPSFKFEYDHLCE